MTKVVKIALISNVTNKDNEEIEYKDVCRCLWDLQNETRDIKNKTVRECWEWYGFSNEYNVTNKEYPKERDFLIRNKADGTKKDYSLDGFIYDKYKADSNLYSGNLTTSMRAVTAAYKNSIKDILKGEKSILSYKANQPLDLHNKAINLNWDAEEKTFYLVLSLLNTAGKKKYGIDTFKFQAVVKDGSTKAILERCYDGVYKISASKLIWNKKKKQWFLNLSYSFEKETKELDKNKVLGVNLGVKYPICASIYGDKGRLIVDGSEIIEFRNRVEARRNGLKRQAAVCGDGRIGHGYKTRMKPVLNIADKIARFRDTFNHKVSRRLIEYAVKNDCGIIQLEDLKGITEDAEPFLKNWSYYDLQNKIEYKAKENGIKVQYINPQYTSQRCSKCGFIHKDNHPERDIFICGHCGFKTLHDYNASQNIGIVDIDKIISKDLKEMKKAEGNNK